MKQAPSPAWAAVVQAEERFALAVAAIPREDLQGVLSWALDDFTSRRAALRILGGADPQLVAEVLPALEPLLLVSHSLLQECRRVLLRLPRGEVLDYLQHLTSAVIADPAADDEAYRRLAELLRTVGADRALGRLVAAAALSTDPDVREVAEDFG